jgi:hypothetical protein
VSGSASLPFQIQLSSSMQAYSSLPFNITSGLTTIQATTARPVVDGVFIDRNTGVGNDFFSLSVRLSRWFRLSERLEAEAVAEAFNLTNNRNDLTRNTNFGSGAYPENPAPNFGQITAVGDPRSIQFALRFRF